MQENNQHPIMLGFDGSGGMISSMHYPYSQYVNNEEPKAAQPEPDAPAISPVEPFGGNTAENERILQKGNSWGNLDVENSGYVSG